MNYFVRPETADGERIGPTIGPFHDFIGLIYDTVQVGPNGDEIAWLDDGYWRFKASFRTADYKQVGSGCQDVPMPLDFTKAKGCKAENWTNLLVHCRILGRGVRGT